MPPPIMLSKPLNCLQIGAEWFPERAGGLNRFYFDLLHHLPSAGIRCTGCVVGRPELWPDKGDVVVNAFAPLDASLPRRWLSERREVTRAMKSEVFDVTVAHFALYAFPVIRQLRAGRPLVIHFQGPWAQESRQEGSGRFGCRAKAALERTVYRRADRLIVLSAGFKSILIDDYGVDANRIHVIPGGIDCGRFEIADSRVDARAQLGWPADRPIVLAVRRLARRMGLENLIEAAAMVRRHVPDVLFLIAGGGPQRPALERMLREHGLQDTVRLLGFIPDADLPRAYRAADLTVVPTTALEGFGLVAAESLATGTPVMATPVGGLVDLLDPLSSSALFEGAGVAHLADGLKAALTGDRVLPSVDTCIAYVRRRFDWTVIAAAVAGVYHEALTDPRLR